MTRFVLSLALALALGAPAFADDALAEVNAARAARGLPPFQPDPGLAAAAQAAADYRAAHLIEGHVPGGMGDFAFLPAGCSADAAGCGALDASWGWQSCCTYESHQYAGAAVSYGRNGIRYMHIFVRTRSRGVVPQAPPLSGPAPAVAPCPPGKTCPAPTAPGVYVLPGSGTTCTNGSCGTVSYGRRGLFRPFVR